MERKTVRINPEPQSSVRKLLEEEGGEGEGAGGGVGYYSAANTEEEFRSDDATRDFIAPTICSLCANSIAAVSQKVDTNHSQFLLTMIR